MASFVLRMFPYDAIAGTLRSQGDLATEKLDGVMAKASGNFVRTLDAYYKNLPG